MESDIEVFHLAGEGSAGSRFCQGIHGTFELSERSLWEHNQETISCAGLVLKEDEAIYNIVL